MSVADLIAQAAAFGVRLTPHPSGGLIVRPAGRLPPELRAEVVARKQEIIAALTSAGITEVGPNRGIFGHFIGTPNGWRCPRCHGTVRMNRGPDGWPCARCGWK